MHGSTAVPITAVTVPASGTSTVGIQELVSWALPIHYPMAQLIGNFGIDGQDTSQMLAGNRVAPYTGQPMSINDLIAAAPELVVLRGGSINDLLGASPSNLAAVVTSCVTNHREILTRMVNGGLKVLDCGIFGYGDGSMAGDPFPDSVRSALLQVNAALATMVSGDFSPASVRYVDPKGTLHDNSGRYIAGMTWDGVHLSLAGGLAQARLEAQAIAAWFGAGTGVVYPGGNLMANPTLQVPGPGLPPDGYLANSPTGATIDTHAVETIDGKTFYTVRATLPAGVRDVTMRLPVSSFAALTGSNEVVGIEFDFFYTQQSGSTPRLTQFDARTDLYWWGNRATHYAGYSERQTSATASSLSGRVVFLPLRLPVAGGNFDFNQSQLWLNLRFGSASGSVLKVGIGNPRLVRVT